MQHRHSRLIQSTNSMYVENYYFRQDIVLRGDAILRPVPIHFHRKAIVSSGGLQPMAIKEVIVLKCCIQFPEAPVVCLYASRNGTSRIFLKLRISSYVTVRFEMLIKDPSLLAAEGKLRVSRVNPCNQSSSLSVYIHVHLNKVLPYHTI